MSRRTERVASELLHRLARIVREELVDPRVGLVTFTRADVAPDLSHAVVYWSVLDLESLDTPERLDTTQEGLDSAASFLRRRAAEGMTLRHMPELRFRYDPSMALGTRTLSVLRDVAAERPEGGDGEEE